MAKLNADHFSDPVGLGKALLEQELLDRILYIGNLLPASLLEDDRPKFVLLGFPIDLIEEVQRRAIVGLSYTIGDVVPYTTGDLVGSFCKGLKAYQKLTEPL